MCCRWCGDLPSINGRTEFLFLENWSIEMFGIECCEWSETLGEHRNRSQENCYLSVSLNWKTEIKINCENPVTSMIGPKPREEDKKAKIETG